MSHAGTCYHCSMAQRLPHKEEAMHVTVLLPADDWSAILYYLEHADHADKAGHIARAIEAQLDALVTT